MPTPIIGIFAECSGETLFSLVMVLALELMEQGKRVLIVDADPNQAPFAGIPGAPIPAGVSLLGLLHDPEARPLLVDCSRVLGNPAALARGGAIQLVPARAEGEPGDPSILAHPPLQGARSFGVLRESLVLAAEGLDVALLVGPVSRSALVTSLLAHSCHAAFLIVDNSAKQVLWLAHTAREADAMRGGLIPSTCVEGRDDGGAVPNGAWQELWRTHPGLLPPHRKGEEGPERLLVLTDSKEDASRLAQAVLDLAQLCVTDGALLPTDAPFLSLYQENRAQAMAMFNASIAPRQGTRTSAVAALKAVWESEGRRWDDVQHLARYVVQKFRWSDPTPEAEEILPIFEALSQAVADGKILERQARVFIDHAGILAHALHWRQAQAPAAGQVLDLLTRACGLERTPGDCLRTAEVLGLHARLAHRWDHYDQALNDVRVFQPHAPRVLVLYKLIDVVSNFATVNASLWDRVLALCADIEPLDPAHAHYASAIALAQMGHPWRALDRVLALRDIDREAFILSFADPDLRPLWELGGSNKLPPHPLQTPKR